MSVAGEQVYSEGGRGCTNEQERENKKEFIGSYGNTIIEGYVKQKQIKGPGDASAATFEKGSGDIWK